MAEFDFIGLKLDVCPQCAGIWFDSGELGSLLRQQNPVVESVEEQHRPSELADPPVLTQKLCPVCTQGMMEYRFQYTSDVVLDTCEGCGGIWVEDEELKAIVDYRSRETGNEDAKARAALCFAELDIKSKENNLRAEIVARRAAASRRMRGRQWIFFGGWF